jgi:hypothetical protein
MVFVLSTEGSRRWKINAEDPFLKTARKVARLVEDRRVEVSLWSRDDLASTVGGCVRGTIGGATTCKP